VCSVALAYLAATVVDATGNYRLIWLFPAATGIGHATVNCWLKIPPKKASSPDMVKRLWEWSIVQAESMAETGIVTGLLAAPVLGVVTKEDADSAVIVDMARKILGNPYGDEDGDDDDESESESSSDGDPADPSDRSDRGVTGVIQVGGGPVGTDLWTDQKSGPRTGSGSASDASGDSVGTPEGGVMPMGSIEGTPVGSEISPDSDSESADQSTDQPVGESAGDSAEDASNHSDASSTGDRFTNGD
jgi:hypothetical protein